MDEPKRSKRLFVASIVVLLLLSVTVTFAGYGPIVPLVDSDGDGEFDWSDNCRDSANSEQRDTDGDGVGDQCDDDSVIVPDLPDSDGDGVPDSDDSCPSDNPDDTDGDSVCDSADPCPSDNPDDTDGDSVCDSADPCPSDNPDDTDGDGVCDSDDTCPGGDDGMDADDDGVPDACDNTAPSVSSVAITPNPLRVEDTAFCSFTFFDADGDPDSSTVEWFVNGASVGTGTTLSYGFVSDDVVTCTVTPNDGQTDGVQSSGSVTVINSSPTVSGVSISPNPLRVGDTAVCTYEFNDPDNNPDSSTVEWFVNGASVGTGTTLSRDFESGDVVTCTVTPNDGQTDGVQSSGSATVINSSPTVSGVSISPDPAYEWDTLTCSYNYSDPDGDPDSSTIEWFVNGVSAGTGSTLSSGFSADDTVRCEVTANDGTSNGNTGYAEIVISGIEH